MGVFASTLYKVLHKRDDSGSDQRGKFYQPHPFFGSDETDIKKTPSQLPVRKSETLSAGVSPQATGCPLSLPFAREPTYLTAGVPGERPRRLHQSQHGQLSATTSRYEHLAGPSFKALSCEDKCACLELGGIFLVSTTSSRPIFVKSPLFVTQDASRSLMRGHWDHDGVL